MKWYPSLQSYNDRVEALVLLALEITDNMQSEDPESAEILSQVKKDLSNFLGFLVYFTELSPWFSMFLNTLTDLDVPLDQSGQKYLSQYERMCLTHGDATTYIQSVMKSTKASLRAEVSIRRFSIATLIMETYQYRFKSGVTFKDCLLWIIAFLWRVVFAERYKREEKKLLHKIFLLNLTRYLMQQRERRKNTAIPSSLYTRLEKAFDAVVMGHTSGFRSATLSRQRTTAISKSKSHLHIIRGTAEVHVIPFLSEMKQRLLQRQERPSEIIYFQDCRSAASYESACEVVVMEEDVQELQQSIDDVSGLKGTAVPHENASKVPTLEDDNQDLQRSIFDVPEYKRIAERLESHLRPTRKVKSSCDKTNFSSMINFSETSVKPEEVQKAVNAELAKRLLERM